MNTRPTHTQVGGWGATAIDSPIGVGICCFCCCMRELFWCRCVFLWHRCVCSCAMCGGRWLVAKYPEVQGTSGFIFPLIILQSETPKLPAALKYKINIFYVGHTYQSTKVEKSVASFKDQREYL